MSDLASAGKQSGSDVSGPGMKGRVVYVEEEQIQAFVHRVLLDEQIRNEFMDNPAAVITRQNFSPRVAQIILLLMPHLALEEGMQPIAKWWHV